MVSSPNNLKIWKVKKLTTHSCKMLLISLAIVFWSPFTAFAVNAATLPSITVFKYNIVDLYEKRTKTLELICHTTGNPTPKIEFQLNGITLTTNSSRVKRHDRNTLHIDNVTYPGDEGNYRCVASNTHGIVFKEQHTKIRTIGDFRPQFKYVKGQNLWIDVILGKTLQLFCPGHTHFYPKSYHWGWFGFPPTYIQENKNRYVTDDGVLFFSSVTQQDLDLINGKGGICCIIYSKAIIKYSIYFGLKKKGTYTNNIPPRLHSRLPATTYVKKGEQKTLFCTASGNPTPQVIWFKNGVQINSNDSQYGINPFQPNKLTLNSVDENLIGQYKCEFKNIAGTAQTEGNVRIAVPPSLTTRLQDSKIPQGNKLHFVCKADGTRPMTYKWYRNGSLLSSFQSESKVMKVDKDVLIISSVNYDDEGTYQCFAINKFGSNSSAASVAIIEPRIDNGGTTQTNKSDNGSTSGGIGGEENKPHELLKTQYIIIIACGGVIFLILVGGGVYMYCRTKDDSQEVRFIPTPRHDLQKPIYAEPDLPRPPHSLTESDVDLSSFGGTKMHHTEFIDLMAEMRYKQNSTTPPNQEHFYYGIPEDLRSPNTTPSTEL